MSSYGAFGQLETSTMVSPLAVVRSWFFSSRRPRRQPRLLTLFGLSYVLGCVLGIFYTSYHCPQLSGDFKFYYIDYFNYEETENEVYSDIAYDELLRESIRIGSNQTRGDTHSEQHKLFSANVTKLRSDALMRRPYVLWTQHYIQVQFECSIKVRMSAISQSGYSLCNPWVLLEKSEGCVAYSFGIGGNSMSLEHEISGLTNGKCSFNFFDEHNPHEGVIKMFDGKLARMNNAESRRNTVRAILDFSRTHGHRKIDILKIGIGGFEFSFVPDFVRKFDGLICHLLIEFNANWTWDGFLWVRLFRLLEKRGFRLFERENKAEDPRSMYYSFLHLSCFEEYGISPGAVFARYFEH